MKKLVIAISLALLSLTAAAQEGYSILIDKGSFTLALLDEGGRQVMKFPVATGENPGQKTRNGDHKTPEGVFPVEWIQNTKGIMFDYHDGVGPVEAYGPWFIHMTTQGVNIGIHGTCPERDDRIGTRDSHGCIRLHNEDLLTLLPYVYPGMKVTIIPGPDDLVADNADKK